ncbi:DUF3768 domain-containing protein [Paracoccus marinaquae]|nr:DUF3768 domain-containing protein [Paracoccus marinaquae]
MLDNADLTYVCAACRHRFEAAEQPCRCPKCRAVGKDRDFPTAEAAEIARQNDLFRLGLVEGMPAGMTGRVFMTPGIANRGPVFQSLCLVAVATFSDFTEDNDPYGDHGFAALTVNEVRIYFKIDLYDETCAFGSEEPANPGRTTRVLTVLLPSEY